MTLSGLGPALLDTFQNLCNKKVTVGDLWAQLLLVNKSIEKDIAEISARLTQPSQDSEEQQQSSEEQVEQPSISIPQLLFILDEAFA